jgi:2,3-bisphosphoglycerate-independent phosphoglycerate mutase
MMVDFTAGEISDAQATELIQALNDQLSDSSRRFFHSLSYRNCLVWEEAPPAGELIAPQDVMEMPIGGFLPTVPGQEGYEYYHLMQESCKILDKHPINEERRARGLRPANSIWLWAIGSTPKLPSFSEKWGIQGTVISAVDLVRGIGIAAGMKTIHPDGTTGNLKSDLHSKAEAAITALQEENEIVYVHIEVTDECSHHGDFDQKRQMIQRIDADFLKPVYDFLSSQEEPFKILITTDHSTPCELRMHTADPVPYLLYDSQKGKKTEGEEEAEADQESNHTLRFTEKDAILGPFMETGEKLLERFINQEPLCPDADVIKFSGSQGVQSTNKATAVFEWFEMFAIALAAVILLMSFAFRHSPVEGSSMYPTLIGHSESSSYASYTVSSGYDILLISNLFYHPADQDIVIIQVPSQLDEPIVKRIIAVGGETVKINFSTWEVWVNGVLLDEPYVNYLENTIMPTENLIIDSDHCWEGVVPEGCVFVLGDNRSVSKDSRYFGFIDERYIIGRVVCRLYPFNRFGTVD